MLDIFTIFELIIFFGSGLAHGIIGFGFPMVATPMLSTFMSVKESVLHTLFPTMSVNANVLKKSGNFKAVFSEYRYLIIAVLVGSFVGTNFLIIFYNDIYILLLALVILLYLNTAKINLSLYDTIQQNPRIMMLFFGFTSGIISGLVNIMIPVLIIYILESKIDKEKALVVMNSCFLTSKALQILIFGTYGSFSWPFLAFMIPVVGTSLFGLFLGTKLRHKLDEELYKKILRLSLWGLAFYLIANYFLK
ncbi:MAG: sulfite exporter TauE/SafE family protein [Sulfurospirillum sp.]|nr:sulfite exporter TauE/SafE family protein [Sulfurospirillum sp.]